MRTAKLFLKLTVAPTLLALLLYLLYSHFNGEPRSIPVTFSKWNRESGTTSSQDMLPEGDIFKNIQTNGVYSPHNLDHKDAASFDQFNNSSQHTLVIDIQRSIPTSALSSQSLQDDHLKVTKFLTLPVQSYTLPVEHIMQQQWMRDLQLIISQIEPRSGPVSLTTCDYKFREILLNWLIASTVKIHPMISHIIVMSMDQQLCDLLKRREFNCVYVSAQSFLKPSLTSTLKKHIAFSELQILRLTVMRFLNHWGYDAVNYDADAILMKNPEHLFSSIFKGSHLISSYGRFPPEIRNAWGGITLCAGMFMVKSSPVTEIFWDAMNAVLPSSYNDQARLNHALQRLDIKWENSHNSNILRDDWQGSTDGGFNVTVLSSLRVCRSTCNRRFRGGYYVWHKGGSGIERKIKSAYQGSVWYLETKWNDIITTKTGADWLIAIST